MKKITEKHDSNQPATQSDIGELAEIMTEGITFLSNGMEDVKTELKKDINELKLRLDKVESQVSDTNRRLRDVEFDTPTRKDFLKLKQRVDLSAVKPSFEP